jgi:imidazole glycerol-phosphate synthase subunit HisF
LLADRRLVKTVRFAQPVYVGDPVNTLNIFSALGADEILLLDIMASRHGRAPDLNYLAQLAEESSVPLGYGGGIRSLADVRSVLAAGFEKVVLNTSASAEPDLVERAAHLAGSQAVVVSVDVKTDGTGNSTAWVRNATRSTGRQPAAYAHEMEQRGAGEILLYSVDRDGTMLGYDLALTGAVSQAVQVPVIACGGAGNRTHLREAVTVGGASAAAAGSLFVFQGPSRNVLVNYLTRPQRDCLFA